MVRLRHPLAALAALAALSLLTGCPKPPAPATNDPAAPPTTASGPTTPEAPPEPSGASEGLRPSWGEPGGIVLGGYMSLTGSIATFGQSSNMAMGLAIDEINAAGGVLGKKLLLQMEDSESKPETSATAVQRLIEIHQAVAILGEVASSNSLAAAPVCQKAGIPMLTPSSTNPRVTRKGDCIFRACFTDDLQGAYLATFAAANLKLKRGAILKDNDSDYSKGLTEVIQATFTKLGGEIVAVEAYTQGEKDFAAVLTKLKDKGLDVLFVPGYYSEVGLIIKQGREAGLEATFIGGDGWDSPKLTEIAGELLDDRCYFVNHYSKSEDRPKAKSFVAAFTQRFGEEPDALAACAYDAVYLIADAITRAGSAEPAKIRQALAETKDFDGVTGLITIDAERNATKPCVVLKFVGGEQAIETTLSPADI